MNFVELTKTLKVMKRIDMLLVFILTIGVVSAQDSQSEDITSVSYGAEIDNQGVLATVEMTEKYQHLAVKDTLNTKFTAKVTEVCKAKGCWMKLKMIDGSEVMVRFKDYGFFMPLDIQGQQVIVHGKAFVEEMSVENQRHYAEDAGKSAEEVAQISEVKKTYGFEADGVLLEQ